MARTAIFRRDNGVQLFRPLSHNTLRVTPLTCVRGQHLHCSDPRRSPQQQRWNTNSSALGNSQRPELHGHGQTEEGARPRSRKTARSTIRALSTLLVLLPAAFVYTVSSSEESKVWLWRRHVKDSPKEPNSISQGFWAYQVSSVERVTDTSFVLTVEPKFEGFLGGLFKFHMKHTYMDGRGRWHDGMWSVDIKEPHVQIARHFTPLPPRDGDRPWDGTLRFYIRSFRGGEMSRYLNALKRGDTIEMRGPHWGFNVKERMGQGERVIFLAGGTGIAPGLQMVREALERNPATKATVLWAVRVRKEVAGLGSVASMERKTTRWLSWTRRVPGQVTADLSDEVARLSNALTEQLSQMQQRYGERLTVQTAVDENATFFASSDIQSYLISQWSSSPSQPTRLSASPTCLLHSQRMQVLTSEKSDWVKSCSCQGEVAKNIFMISGPEGFIRHFAGAKTWRDGEEKQGQLGGIVGDALRHSRCVDDWLVLKL